MTTLPVHLKVRTGERGATAVEFALVLLPLFVVTVGTLDAGRLVVSRAMLSYATIVGGRAAVAQNTASSAAVQTAVVAAAPMLGLTTGNVTVTTSAASWAARKTGDTVTVKITNYKFHPVFAGWALHTWTVQNQAVIP